MHALGIESLVVSHAKQGLEYIATDLCVAGLACYAESIAATGNFYVQPAFYLPQVFIKLTAEVGEAVIVGGLEDDVPRNLDSVQSTVEISAKCW